MNSLTYLEGQALQQKMADMYDALDEVCSRAANHGLPQNTDRSFKGPCISAADWKAW